MLSTARSLLHNCLPRIGRGNAATRDNEGAPRAPAPPHSEEDATVSRRTTVLNVFLGLTLVMAAAASFAHFGSTRAQDNGLASITIYNSVCPTDYLGADYYVDCYGIVGSGYGFDL